MSSLISASLRFIVAAQVVCTCVSCLPMLATQQLLVKGPMAGELFSSSMTLVWRGNIQSFSSFGLQTPQGFRVSPADSYSLLMGVKPALSGEWACYHDKSSYYWAGVAGQPKDAGMYVLRHGIAVNGLSGAVEVNQQVHVSSNDEEETKTAAPLMPQEQ